MGSPLRVETVLGLSPRSERRLLLSFGFLVGSGPLRWGHPFGSNLRWGLKHSIGTKAYPVHLFYDPSRWGHPVGQVWS